MHELFVFYLFTCCVLLKTSNQFISFHSQSVRYAGTTVITNIELPNEKCPAILVAFNNCRKIDKGENPYTLIVCREYPRIELIYLS